MYNSQQSWLCLFDMECQNVANENKFKNYCKKFCNNIGTWQVPHLEQTFITLTMVHNCCQYWHHHKVGRKGDMCSIGTIRLKYLNFYISKGKLSGLVKMDPAKSLRGKCEVKFLLFLLEIFLSFLVRGVSSLKTWSLHWYLINLFKSSLSVAL